MRWRIVLAIFALLIVGVAGAVYVQRDALAMRLYARIVEQNMGRTSIGAAPDGLHAGFCGTGSPMPDRTRAGACLAVVAGERLFIFDAGSGSSETLTAMGLAPGAIEAVFLTHFHSDHIDDLGALALQRWAGGSARTPLRVIGPTGVERIAAGFNEAYALDMGFRVAHHGPEVVPPSGAGITASPFSLPQGADRLEVFNDGGVRIIAFRVDHGPVTPAMGYRIEYRGRSILVSGDTVPSAVLEREARGVDLLVHEALSPRMLQVLQGAATRRNLAGVAHIMEDIQDYHTTPAQAAEIAQRAGAGALALTHIVPPVPSRLLEGSFLGDARARFSGPVWIMNDGDLISLPAQGGMSRRSVLQR